MHIVNSYAEYRVNYFILYILGVYVSLYISPICKILYNKSRYNKAIYSYQLFIMYSGFRLVRQQIF